MQHKITPNKIENEKAAGVPQQSLQEKIRPGESTTHQNQPHTAPPMEIVQMDEAPPNTAFSQAGPA